MTKRKFTNSNTNRSEDNEEIKEAEVQTKKTKITKVKSIITIENIDELKFKRIMRSKSNQVDPIKTTKEEEQPVRKKVIKNSKIKEAKEEEEEEEESKEIELIQDKNKLKKAKSQESVVQHKEIIKTTLETTAGEKFTKVTKMTQSYKYKKLNRNRSLMEDALDHYVPSDKPIVLGDGKIPGNKLLIASWNVNGLNALLKKEDLYKYMKDKKPDILCLNETKLTDENFEEKGVKWIPEEYTYYFNCCKIKKGYSGTAIVSKYKPISVKFDFDIKKHALEGRTITLEFETFYLVGCYVPNAGDGLCGLDYRVQEWDVDLRAYVNELKKTKRVILCGDMNCAHKEIDIHEPKRHEKSPGFTPQERKSFGELIDSGFVDTFRHFYPEEVKYSFFTVRRFNYRQLNKGWRFDYFLVDQEAIPAIKDSVINNDVYGSDHLPVELTIDPTLMK